MCSLSILRNVGGIIGNVVAVILFLSPAPTFLRIWKKKAVEQYSPDPYLATLITCMVWVLYGLPMVHPNSWLVVTTNGCGTAIELFYLVLYVIYSDNRKRITVLLVVLLEVIFMAVVSSLVLTLAHDIKTRTFTVGIMGIIFNILMYASPLSVMKLVITTKSVEYMPFFLSLAALSNGVAWTIYSFLRSEYFILIPNGLGTLLAIAQLALYGIYYKPTKKQVASRQTSGELVPTEVVVDGHGADGHAPHNGHTNGVKGKT